MQFDERESGIPLIGVLPWGTHFCQFYQTKEDILEILVPYFRAGLENNELCIWNTARPVTVAEAKKALQKSVPDLEHYVKTGQIEIIAPRRRRAEEKTAGGMLASRLDRAIAGGFDGLRLSCHVLYEKKDGKAFGCYEVNAIEEHHVIAAFFYPRERFDALGLMDVVKNHRFALIRHAGKWEIIERSELRIIRGDLKKNQEKFRTLFSNMSEGFAYSRIVLDAGGEPCDYVFLEVNKAFEKIAGIKRGEIIGKKVTEVLPGIEKDPAGWIEKCGKVALTGVPIRFESSVEQLNRWFAVSAFSPHRGFLAVTFSDTTESKRAEEALQHERDVLQAVMNGAKNSHLAYLDRDFNFVRVNETYAQACGYRPEEMIGKNHFELYPHEENESIFARVRDTGEPATFIDKPFEFPDQPERGVTFWDWTLTPVKDSVGRVVGLAFSLFETTEHKRALDAVQQAKAEWERTFDSVPDLIAIVDNQHRILRANRAMAERLGQSSTHCVGSFCFGAIHGTDDPPDFCPHTLTLADGREHVAEIHEARLGGDFLVSTTPLTDAAGRLIGSVHVARDITERKHAEEALKRNNERLEILSQTASGLLATVNPQQLVQELCTRVMTFLDCDVFFNFLVNEKIGRLRLNAFAGIPEETAREIEWLDYGVAVCGCAARDACRIVAENIPTTPDVRTELVKSFGIKAYACHPLMAQGQVIGTLSFGTRLRNNFSEDDLALMKAVADQVAIAMSRVRSMESLLAAKTDLERHALQVEAINRELESFSYSVSHDLRTPLRAIEGFTRMILNKHADQFDEDARAKFEVIRDNTRKMGRLIDELLAFSRLSRTQLSVTALDIEGLVREVWEELKALSPDRRLRLKIAEIAHGKGDRGLVKQVLVNLLSNAIKFTGRREEALIEAGCEKHDGEIAYYIRDNGAGFDMQYYGKLFGVFQRLHSTGDFEGTGVGLAIVQRIINRHGGKVWAEGKVDEGATFFFTLPTRQE